MNRQLISPVTQSDIAHFGTGSTDFAFEMRVLNQLTSLGVLHASHGGTYIDPFTKLPRQFDIQAEVIAESFTDDHLRVLLAIECKNLTEYGPILVHRCERTRQESSHFFFRASMPDGQAPSKRKIEPTSVDVVENRLGRYQWKQMVGKSLDHITRKGNGDLKSDDSEVYNRWTQAIASATSLIPRCQDIPRQADEWMTVILPILVVPDNRIFVADYQANGSLLGTIRPESEVSFFLGHRPPVPHSSFSNFTFTHLEIMSETAIRNFVSTLLTRSNILSETLFIT